MTTSGTVEKELSALQAFLTKTESSRYENDIGVSRLRASATKMHMHLRRPIRVLVAGCDGADDLALANALAGDLLVPSGAISGDYPPFVFTHGPSIAAAPGWWGKKVEKTYKQIDFDRLAEPNPNFIILQVPNPLLLQINLICVPGFDGPAHADRLQNIARHSEMLLWRTNATDVWSKQEQQTWRALPEPIRKLGILTVTNVDLPIIQHQSKEITARLFMEAKPGFKAIFPLRANATADTRQDHQSDDWEASGGQALLTGILHVAKRIRENDARTARAAIDQHLRPYLAEADEAKSAPVETMPAPTPLPGAENASPEQNSTTSAQDDGAQDTVPEHPILAKWQLKIAELLALLAKADAIETSGFLTASSNIVADMADLISDPGVLDTETAWLQSQFLDAVDLLILLEMENGDEPIVEAINVLLQLSRDLSWIASKS